jgi:anti-anti-sigma factor
LPSGDSHNQVRGADRHAWRLAAEASVKACAMDVQRADHEITLVLAGEFDQTCVRRFERLLREALEDPVRCLVVDLRKVSFIDSTGLALLLRSEAAARQDGFELQILRSGAPAVLNALEASGLERVLPFVDGDA